MIDNIGVDAAMDLNRMLAPGVKRRAIDLLRDYHISRFILCPNFWGDFKPPAPALKWTKVKFDVAGVNSLPNDKAGIYSFIAHPGIANHEAVSYLLYIGETTRQSLRERCKSYLDEPKRHKNREHILDMVILWPNHLWIYYAPIADKSKILDIEERLITAFLPPFNINYTATIGKSVKLRRILYSVLTK